MTTTKQSSEAIDYVVENYIPPQFEESKKRLKKSLEKLLLGARLDEFAQTVGIFSEASELGNIQEALKVRDNLVKRQAELEYLLNKTGESE